MENPVFNANSVDPDQRPRSVASYLGLNCLLMSLLWDARHKGLSEQTSTISCEIVCIM